MKKLLTVAAALLSLTIAFAPAAFASDAEKALNECKSAAESDEVASADIKIYVSNCMKEMEISADEITAMVDAEYSAGEQETAKSTAEE